MTKHRFGVMVLQLNSVENNKAVEVEKLKTEKYYGRTLYRREDAPIHNFQGVK